MESNKKNVPVLSVKKALDLLEMLIFQDVKRNGIRLSDLAAKLEIPDNTARNLLKTMVECGFVAQNSESRYIMGKKCQQIGSLNGISSKRSEEDIKNALTKFNEKINETIVFAILADGYREVIAEVASRKEVKVVFERTSSVNIYDATTGRVLAAYAEPEELERIIERYGLPGEYWDNIKDIGSLKKALSVIRDQGHVLMPKWDELISFAIPVLNEEGKLIGSVGCYAPIFRCPKKKQTEIISALNDVASDLAQRLS